MSVTIRNAISGMQVKFDEKLENTRRRNWLNANLTYHEGQIGEILKTHPSEYKAVYVQFPDGVAHYIHIDDLLYPNNDIVESDQSVKTFDIINLDI